ncbi:MAG TPA: NAD(P)H-dependent oxidoreductase [Burkholderiales bacterium]|jgi:FMN-dependent NADH-azoreductase|nr:NAD(P)H-dependent oxidoreductase [Burkholderiales bacterium]
MKVLQLDSSILGESSVSRQLTQLVVDRIRESEPHVKVVHRDLGREPVAHLTLDLLATRGTAADLLNELQNREARLDAELIDELKAADVLVIGAPLYNFTIPTGLKAWIDRIAVAGKTFKYGEKGPEGLVKGKKAVIVATSGGTYADSPVDTMHVGYLKQVLNFIGITDIEVVRAPGLATGTDARAHALATARGQIVHMFVAQAA